MKVSGKKTEPKNAERSFPQSLRELISSTRSKIKKVILKSRETIFFYRTSQKIENCKENSSTVRPIVLNKPTMVIYARKTLCFC